MTASGCSPAAMTRLSHQPSWMRWRPSIVNSCLRMRCATSRCRKPATPCCRSAIARPTPATPRARLSSIVVRISTPPGSCWRTCSARSSRPPARLMARWSRSTNGHLLMARRLMRAWPTKGTLLSRAPAATVAARCTSPFMVAGKTLAMSAVALLRAPATNAWAASNRLVVPLPANRHPRRFCLRFVKNGFQSQGLLGLVGLCRRRLPHTQRRPDARYSFDDRSHGNAGETVKCAAPPNCCTPRVLPAGRGPPPKLPDFFESNV